MDTNGQGYLTGLLGILNFFVAAVLNIIPSKVHYGMMQQVISRMSNNDFGNNNHGKIQIIREYTDDGEVNALIPTCGIQLFMTLFESIEHHL